jgi:hypothetical protein
MIFQSYAGDLPWDALDSVMVIAAEGRRTSKKRGVVCLRPQSFIILQAMDQILAIEYNFSKISISLLSSLSNCPVCNNEHFALESWIVTLNNYMHRSMQRLCNIEIYSLF